MALRPDQHLDYLAHLTADSNRFLELLEDADPALSVPSCPEWRVDDLLWHLAEVQWFWGSIVRDRLRGPEPAEAGKPSRPSDRAELVALFRQASGRLAETLRSTPADERVWTWSDDQSAAFVRRRQAHEALIHRVDAELTVGARSQLDVALASDGVDEVLRVMLGGTPGWATFTPVGAAVDVVAADTGARWRVQPGRFRGTSPSSGRTYDEPSLEVLGEGQPPPGGAGAAGVATVRGRAADLDLWLWGRRPIDRLDADGDRAALQLLADVVAAGID